MAQSNSLCIAYGLVHGRREGNRQRLDTARAALATIAQISLLLATTQTSAAVEPANGSDQLDTIVVTAQKRTENLQEVPISAQVIGGQARLDKNLNTLDDLAQTIPDVHVGEAGRSDELFIRGIGGQPTQFAPRFCGSLVGTYTIALPGDFRLATDSQQLHYLALLGQRNWH
jgi:outer membrane receptor protein involved in Fe transport